MKKIILFLLIYFPLQSQEYKTPPEVITSLIEADPQPTLNLNNKGNLALILMRDGYKSIQDLARGELRIAGTRLDPSRYTSSRMTYYNSFSLLDVKSGKQISITHPKEGKFSFFSWSPDEQKVAFTNTTDNGVELWILDVRTKKSIKVTDKYLNDIIVKPFQWYNSGSDLLVSIRCDKKMPNINIFPSC